jgi:signal transduction histidine kinase
MAKLLNKSLVFLGCLILYSVDVQADYRVASVIAAIIVSALCSYWDNPRLYAALVSLYAIAAWIFPPLVYFTPLLCYDIMFGPCVFTGLLFIPALLRGPGLTSAAMLLFLAAAAALLKNYAVRFERLEREYTRLRDDTREYAFSAEQKNKDLLERQDYEINLATLNERNRIAREIHDHVGHTMSRALLQVGALSATVKDADTLSGLLALRETLSAGMDSIRQSVHDLHEDSMDLEAQLVSLVNGFSFCPVRLDYDVHTPPPLKARYAVVAIAKEGLSNIMRHSDATTAVLIVREQPGLYQLILQDNGSPKRHPGEGGMGLQSITARAEGLNGHMHIDTGRGFRLFISIPKENSTQKGNAHENSDR